MSLQSVSNSETDVTVNLTRFAKVLVRRTTQKLSKYKWMDPSKDWGQNEGSQGAGEQGNDGKTGNLFLQEGELPKFSLYCLLLRRQASQGQGSLQMLIDAEATIKHKKLIMITSKVADNLHWQLVCNVACILVLNSM